MFLPYASTASNSKDAAQVRPERSSMGDRKLAEIPIEGGNSGQGNWIDKETSETVNRVTVEESNCHAVSDEVAFKRTFRFIAGANTLAPLDQEDYLAMLRGMA